MKKPGQRLMIALVLAGALAGAAILFQLGPFHGPTSRSGPSPGSGKPAATPQPSGGLTEQDADRRRTQFIENMSEEDRRAKPAQVSMEVWAEYVAFHQRNLEQNGEIDFFGKVVDERGGPLQGVSIRVDIDAFQSSIGKVMASPSKDWMITTPFTLRTDRNGEFQIRDATGVQLVFSLFQLDGYRIDPAAKLSYSFVPDGVPSEVGGRRHRPDPGQPVLFVMKKIPPR